MQTHFTAEQLADPKICEADEILRKCVHCGFCTATCPTFVITGDERDSPRGCSRFCLLCVFAALETWSDEKGGLSILNRFSCFDKNTRTRTSTNQLLSPCGYDQCRDSPRPP